MDSAYQKFFKEHAGYPKFKSKHDRYKSYTTNFTNGNITVDFDRERIKLPKLKKDKSKNSQEFCRANKIGNYITTAEWKVLCSNLSRNRECKKAGDKR